VLRTPAEPVTDFDLELRNLVKDLTETMLDAPGVGLAAPQIGVSLRVFTYHVDDNEPGHLINPVLKLEGDPEEDDEGCLSLPGLQCPTRRRDRGRRRGPPRGARMIVVTTPYLPGHRITESKGMVFGLVVRSRGLGGNLMASIRSLGGGEIHEYTSLLEDTRRQALDRLVQNASLLGANAVLSMRFDSSELSGTMSEIVAYGTAVVVTPDGSTAPTTPVE